MRATALLLTLSLLARAQKKGDVRCWCIAADAITRDGELTSRICWTMRGEGRDVWYSEAARECWGRDAFLHTQEMWELMCDGHDRPNVGAICY
ncbi:hypothetical protein Tdes44962_MAKER09861 [Teratosphaeria destructans]|uniref:Uncharacterized protein n=1 Tax=Teratosphaeria destructans TaxID=418781 RepID=A0A9W7SR14_9PEZI|nr:hypothetical protein Tdes44962_MAKER09861 [Teratosphaeria destructans]